MGRDVDETMTAIAEPLELLPAPEPAAEPEPATPGGLRLQRGILAQLAQVSINGLELSLGELARSMSPEPPQRRAWRLAGPDDQVQVAFVEGHPDRVELPALSLSGRITRTEQQMSADPAQTFIVIEARTDAGEQLTITRRGWAGAPLEVELRPELPYGRRELSPSHWMWSCPIGNIDDCSSHRWGEGMRAEDYARMVEPAARWTAERMWEAYEQVTETFRRDAAALEERRAQFQAQRAWAIGDADEAPPQNRLERRAAAAMARAGRPFRRDRLRERVAELER